MAFDVEQLFQSIDIILTQRLQDVNFDKTIICTIVDDSDKKNGCYVVSDGTIKFNAYVSDATYRKDDQVRVSILNGDFSEKKFITGKYTRDESSSPITYKSPLESIIPITDNLVTETRNNNNGVNGLKANSEVIQTELWRADLTSNNEFRDLQSNGIYNTLTLKADFKTLLSKYDLVSGNYGLRLDLFIQPSFDNPTQRIRRYVTLDSSEMMGNPYAFAVYSTQAKKVDIVSTGVIAEMVLWMYQSINGDGEGRKFIEKSGKEIPVNEYIDDILVKNIEIGFGSDIEKVENNTLQIFTSSPPYYVYQDPTDFTNKKDIELLWYNKTDENKYIGFSDCEYDPDYDEIEYLELSNQDARLCAQLGRDDIPDDENGLKLAADLKDAKPLMIKARDIFTSDISEILQSLQRQIVKNSDELNTMIDDLVGQNKGLMTVWNQANTAIENWSNSYVNNLQWAYNKQNNIDNNEITFIEGENTDYYVEYCNAINNGIKLLFNNDPDNKGFFNQFDAKTQPTSGYLSANRGNYDLYSYRVANEVEKIESLLSQIDELLNGNYEKLQRYNDVNYKFYKYKVTDFSPYHNKYCLYWYRYERGYKLDYITQNREYSYGNFVGDGWRRLTIEDEGIKHNNFGLPNQEDSKNPGYYAAKPVGQSLSRTMDRNLTEEKYMAVLFRNHEMYKSNVITFINSEPDLIPNDIFIDKKDALKIEHDVASYEHYQSYNEFNLLKSLEDGGKVRQLKCFYEGLFRGDEALIDAGIYWYIPNHSTMLTVDVDDLIKEGFNTDYYCEKQEEKTKYSIDGYTYFYKKIRSEQKTIKNEDGEDELITTSCAADRYFFYKIKPILEKDAKNNTIFVKAYLKGVEDPVEGEITMTFSTFGTNGTKYTLSIAPATSKSSVGGKDETKPLELAVRFKDNQNNSIPITDASDNNQLNSAYKFSIESWNNLPNAYSYNILKDKDSNVTGLNIFLSDEVKNTWDKNTPYFGIINAKIQFDMEGQEIDNSVEKYQKYRVTDLNTLYAVPYSSADMYYMSGATHVVYNNQGVVSYVSEDKYELYTINDKGNTPVENQIWSIRYYDKDGKQITNGTGNSEIQKTWNMLVNYMPIINSENRLTPAPLYIEGLDYIPVVICEVNGNIAWVQPIIITQNRYASSTLNDWNGSFTIDEKNGTVLATSFGAGKKENDNSFSGVLMGDIAKGKNFDNDNIDGLGIYGFNKGAQSFCLSSDGRAFFGKAGSGRIYFDGDKGTISSASYEIARRDYKEVSSSGTLIDLDDGYIHMLGSTLNKTPDITVNERNEIAQAEILLSTGYLDGFSNAYFKIRSKEQFNKDHYLIYIGDKDYYLQTDNYSEVVFNSTDQKPNDTNSGSLNPNGNGSGFKLNLKDGMIDAYNFKLTSKNVMINSRDDYDPYFIVKNNEGKNLICVGEFGTGNNRYEDFYLQSPSFQSATNENEGQGIRINLIKDPSIEAYNFTLSAGWAKYKPIVTVSDGNKTGGTYLEVNTILNNEVKTLVHISKDSQYLKSSNYEDGESGMLLDIGGNKLHAYTGFLLRAQGPTGQDQLSRFIEINAGAEGAEGTPLMVGSNFQVDWAGNIKCTGLNAENATLSGKLYTTNLEVEGTLVGGTIDGATIIGGVLKVGATSGSEDNLTYQLYADESGVTIQNAVIQNCTIENSSITNGDGSSAKVYIPKGGSGGLITSNNFITCYVTNTLYVGTSTSSPSNDTTPANINPNSRAMYPAPDAGGSITVPNAGKKGTIQMYSGQILFDGNVSITNNDAGLYLVADKITCSDILESENIYTTSLSSGGTSDITVTSTLNLSGCNIVIDGDTIEDIIADFITNNVTIELTTTDNNAGISGSNGSYLVTSPKYYLYSNTAPSIDETKTGQRITTYSSLSQPTNAMWYTTCNSYGIPITAKLVIKK